ncbi:MAG: PfkB family carbohydrate kinase, partial [Planctomycetota bacterium]
MILTVTPNPSMDRTVEVPGFDAGGTFGARLVSLRPAGKGVNVSRCLAALGTGSTATGLVGRDAASEFRSDLARAGIETAFVETASRVRACTTVIDPRPELAEPAVTHVRERG